MAKKTKDQDAKADDKVSEDVEKEKNEKVRDKLED